VVIESCFFDSTFCCGFGVCLVALVGTYTPTAVIIATPPTKLSTWARQPLPPPKEFGWPTGKPSDIIFPFIQEAVIYHIHPKSQLKDKGGLFILAPKRIRTEISQYEAEIMETLDLLEAFLNDLKH
jgi:hypothetical protein